MLSSRLKIIVLALYLLVYASVVSWSLTFPYPFLDRIFVSLGGAVVALPVVILMDGDSKFAGETPSKPLSPAELIRQSQKIIAHPDSQSSQPSKQVNDPQTPAQSPKISGAVSAPVQWTIPLRLKLSIEKTVKMPIIMSEIRPEDITEAELSSSSENSSPRPQKVVMEESEP